MDDTLILNTHPSLRVDYAVATSKEVSERRRRDTVPQKKPVSTSHNSGPALRRQRDVSKEGPAAKRKKRESVSLGGGGAKTSLTVSISVEDPKVTKNKGEYSSTRSVLKSQYRTVYLIINYYSLTVARCDHTYLINVRSYNDGHKCNDTDNSNFYLVTNPNNNKKVK